MSRFFIKKWHAWAAIAVAIVAVVALVLCVEPYRNFEKIDRTKTLKVVTAGNSVGYFVENDSVRGFHYELVKCFAEKHGWELQFFFENDLNRSIFGLNNGKYDLILRNIPTTEPLKKRIAFSEPILFDRLVLVQKLDSATKRLAVENGSDLDDIAVYLEKNSPYELHLRHLQEELDVNFEIKTEKKATAWSLIQMVSCGEIAFAACDEFTARSLKTSNPEIDFSLKLSFRQPNAWGIHNENVSLKSAVDAWLKEFVATKEFRDLYRKYYLTPK